MLGRKCSEPGCEAEACPNHPRCAEHMSLLDTEVMALGDPPRGEDDDDDWREGDDEEDEDDWPMDCHMGPDGQCGAAGSEWCDFECPVMRDWRREPWDENGPIKEEADG